MISSKPHLIRRALSKTRIQNKVLLIALATLGLLSTPGFATSKPITPQDLFHPLSPTEPWRKGKLTAAKTVNFTQTASGGTDATTVSKVQLAYFTSADCTGAKSGNGFYSTPDGTSYGISVGSAFGLVAASTWNVGVNKLGISTNDMANIQSVAITLKSTNSDVPQSNFSSNSFACVAVTCAANACTSAAGPQSFELKTTAAVGDPADGGVIADVLGGLIATAADDSTSIEWGGYGTETRAQSDTGGAENTSAIVTELGLGNYAAQLCNDLPITGGYTTGWFLPAKEQLNTLYTNRVNIGGFAEGLYFYWSSTEFADNLANNAWNQNFDDGGQSGDLKSNFSRVRCVRGFKQS